MKKIAIIVRSLDAEQTVKDLRSLGVLHVEHQQPPQGKDITALQEELVLVNNALDVFRKNEELKKLNISQEKITADWHIQAKHLIDLEKRHERLQMYAQKLEATIAEWQNWGDFSPQKMQELAQKNIYVSLYQVPIKQLDVFPKEAVIKNIFTSGGIAHCIVISQKKFEVPFKEIPLPRQSLSQMKKRLSEDSQLMHALKDEISQIFCFEHDFIKIKQNLEKEMELHRAIKGMAEVGALTYIVGYAPVDKNEILRKKALTEQWGIVISDPLEDDNVPVLLRNPKWISIINPLFKLMEVVPGYRELDTSPLFLLFLSLFFGMIIGDAGYGAVYFMLTLLAQFRFGKKAKDKRVFFLFYLFSFCAIMWGLLTGTVFGQQWYLAKGFKALVPLLNQTKFLMSFCFFLGALQLSLAHGWQAMMKLPSMRALADAGFICLLWAGFFLAKMFIVGDSFPSFGKGLIWSGILLIVFFSEPSKNILKTAAKGMGVLALGITGNFGDVVSYIRLFAVGLAGVAVSDSVNALAAGVGSNIIAQAVILFIGHTINIMLGPISVLVHGIRLNILEFSVLHGNVTWSGLAYKPLKS